MQKEEKIKPEVLVILPTLGQRIELLKQTLESISAQDCQFDLVMVYPLKDKVTSDLARKYGATSIDDPGGISAAINVGIAYAKPWHTYIGWLGDDDLLAKGSLSTTSAALNKEFGAAVAYGYCDYIDHKGRKLFTSRAGAIAPWLMTWGPNLMPLPGMLFRKSALEKVGNFDESNRYSMDLDVLLKMRKLHYTFVNTKTTLASFRWHPESTSVASRKKSLSEAASVKKASLPVLARPFTLLWEVPIRIASLSAAKRLTAQANK